MFRIKSKYMTLLIKTNLNIFIGLGKLVICFLYKGPEGVCNNI